MKTFLFLDTNIYLHFRQFDQIKWKELLNNEDFTIVVPYVVISELDKKKIDDAPRISKQARKIIKLLEEYSESETSPNLVKMKFLENESSSEIFTNNALSPSIPDDRLIANIIEEKEKNNVNCVLVSNDFGVRLKAKKRKIKTIKVPDEYQIKIENSTEKKLKEIERENALLKNKIPDLKIYFDNNEECKEFELVKNAFKNCDLEKSLLEIKNKVPYVSLENEIQKSDNILNAILKRAFVNQEIVDRHNRQVDEYYKNYEKYLSDMIKYSDIFCKSIKVNLVLINSGIVPAKDIHIDFHIPDGVDVMKERDYPREPKKPEVPYLYSYFDFSKSYLHNHSWQDFQIPHAQNLPSPNVSNFTIKKTNSYNMSMSVFKLMHQTKIDIKPFYIIFGNPEKTQTFAFTYSMIGENIPKRIKGSLRIKLK